MNAMEAAWPDFESTRWSGQDEVKIGATADLKNPLKGLDESGEGSPNVLALDPRNPIALARMRSSSWHYFHTHVVTSNDLEASLLSTQPRSIELDVYTTPDGVSSSIQHPPVYYTSKRKPRPANLPLEEAVALFEAAGPNAVVVLDAKSRTALDTIAGLVARLGTHRVVVHAFAQELAMDPLPDDVSPEPHTVDEDVPLAEVIRAASPPGSSVRAAVMLTCRHVTPERLAARDEFRIVDRILAATKSASGGIDVIGLWLPGGRAPPIAVRDELLQNDLLVSFNIDSELSVTGAEEMDYAVPYVGMTDVLSRATVHESDGRMEVLNPAAL